MKKFKTSLGTFEEISVANPELGGKLSVKPLIVINTSYLLWK